MLNLPTTTPCSLHYTRHFSSQALAHAGFFSTLHSTTLSPTSFSLTSCRVLLSSQGQGSVCEGGISRVLALSS